MNNLLLHKNRFLIFLITLMMLSGCAGKASSTNKTHFSPNYPYKTHNFRHYDWVKVTSPTSNQVIQIINHQAVNYVSDIIGNVGDSSYLKLGSHHKSQTVIYHYTFYQAKPKYKIDINIFRDSEYIEITQVPGFKSLEYRLPTKTHKILMDPTRLATGQGLG